jgi:hypothetical protein
MFLSIEQIASSLGRLEQIHPFFGMSLLIFCREQIPVGTTTTINFGGLAAELLEAHYKASLGYEGYYNPFQPPTVKGRWVKADYNHTTLQRITADTFSGATIHPKKSQLWGWSTNYIRELKKKLKGSRLPAFDLAVWMFREDDWPAAVRPDDACAKLVKTFRIPTEVVEELVDVSIPQLADPWLSKYRMTERQLLRVIGFPPGAAPEEGAAIASLDMRAVGPASRLDYKPGERLNIITGDNSLGKTFLLECIWWALTGGWLGRTALPRGRTGAPKASITYSIKGTEGATLTHKSTFAWESREWSMPKDRKVLAGLVIYARHDGAFAVWDPAKVRLSKSITTHAAPWMLLDKKELWDGKRVESSLGDQWLCNGLLRDWVTWQTGGDRYKDQFAALKTCLDRLSPSRTEALVPGEPTRMPPDTREIPTLKMAYGDVPVLLASAGVQRILGVAYILVWAWFEHLTNSQATRKSPQRRLVFIIDEVEAHLHPRWQRVIVPALVDVINLLSEEITPQVHLATHSPMVMASTETIFSKKTDELHHLRLDKERGDVQLDELPFVKRGTVDQWLMSEVFDLNQARSVPAEEAIDDAKSLQESDTPDPGRVKVVNERLVATLAPDDDFWPRWRFFAKKHGVDK